MRSLHDEIVYSEEPEVINSPAFYDCCIHLLCIAGSIRFEYNGKPFVMATGDIAVLSAPRSIGNISIDKGTRVEYLAAPNKFLHTLLPANNYSIQGRVSLFDNPVMHASQAQAELFRQDILNIRRRMNDTDHRFYTEMMGSMLQTMIYDLFDFHASCNENILTTDRVGYIVSQFFNMIMAGVPMRYREVSYYASQLHVTPKYLSDTIKRVTGISVSAHINRAAAAIIIEYLKSDKLSITQIADEMNFNSVSYFSRYCTKHVGMSPARFRLSGDRSKY